MKSLNYTILGLFILVSSQLYAQNAKISGKASDKNHGEPIAFATLKLTSSKGEVKGIFVGENGEFQFSNLLPDTYTLEMTAVGFENYVEKNIEITNPNQSLKLAEVKAETSTKVLSEVVVKSGIGATKIEPQKIVYNTADLPVAKGASVGDMLRLMPSTAMGGPPGVPRDIRYRGLEKSYTLVLIDGKNAGISGNNREVLLTQIPASAVERIEIIANPGAQYDGDGMNGVVNIILKKNTKFGTNGQVMGGINSQGGYNASVQAGHKFDKGEIYGSFDQNQIYLRGANGILENNDITQYKNNAISGYQRINSQEDRNIFSQNLKIGTRWDVWKGATLGAEFVKGVQKEIKFKSQDTETLKADRTFSARTLRTEEQTENFDFNEYSLNFAQNFEKKGRLTFSYTHVGGFYPKPKYQIDQKLNAQGQPSDTKPALTNTFEDSFDRNNFLQTDFSWQYNERFNLNAGLKFSGRNRESLQLVERYDYNKALFNKTEAPASNFDSQENIYAGYVQGTFTTGKFRSVLGLRTEYTTFYNKSKSKDFTTEGTYLIPLPSATIVYNIDKTQYLKFTVDRKIRRAAFKDLSPFVDSTDVTKIKAGNPLLRPEKAWGFELGYLKTGKNWNIGANLFRRNIDGLIQKVLTDVKPGVVLEKPENINAAYVQGVELLGAVRLFKRWNINASYSQFSSELNDPTLGGGDAIKDQFAWSAKLISDLEIGKNTFVQVAWNGIGPKVSSQKTENTIQFFDASINQHFMNKKILLSVRMSDIFDTNNKITAETTTAQQSNRFQDIAGRQVFVNLSYSF
jgi:outer membrane receptor protein involved in Fe transport